MTQPDHRDQEDLTSSTHKSLYETTSSPCSLDLQTDFSDTLHTQTERVPRNSLARHLCIDPNTHLKSTKELTQGIRERWPQRFDCALVAGSGIHEALSSFERCDHVSYVDIPGLNASHVVGHVNRLEWRRIAGLNVLVFSGRFHRYEGNELDAVIVPISICYGLGIPSVILTNAAGGLNRDFHATDIMLCEDVLNMSFVSVHSTQRQTRPSLIDSTWLRAVRKALGERPWLRSGVYCSVSGPSYETRAEIGMFARFADAIGMSTIHELQAAAALGLQAIACSVITNVVRADEVVALQHAEVVENARIAASQMALVIEACCQVLSSNVQNNE